MVINLLAQLIKKYVHSKKWRNFILAGNIGHVDNVDIIRT